jgi:hypothetical protein
MMTCFGPRTARARINHSPRTGRSSSNVLPAGVDFAFPLGQGTDMSLASFVQAHAAHADWRWFCRCPAAPQRKLPARRPCR